jgi:hypothetical protein
MKSEFQQKHVGENETPHTFPCEAIVFINDLDFYRGVFGVGANVEVKLDHEIVADSSPLLAEYVPPEIMKLLSIGFRRDSKPNSIPNTPGPERRRYGAWTPTVMNDWANPVLSMMK